MIPARWIILPPEICLLQPKFTYGAHVKPGFKYGGLGEEDPDKKITHTVGMALGN